MRKETGFTLIELMVTIAVMAIMAAIALPAMGTFIEKQQVKSSVNKYMNTLTFARNEAIRQNIPVVACGANLSSAGQLTTNGCGANWSEGLFLFGDVDGDHSYTAGKDINIRVTQSPNSNQKSVVTINVEAMPNTVSGTSLSSNPVVQFYPNGQVGVRVGSSTDDEFLIGSNFLQMSVISMDNSTISSVGLLDPVGRVINCGVKAKKENSGNKIAKLCKFES